MGKTKKEILITGFGGQGIVLAGRIMGQSATLGDRKHSTLVQAYGPEARGGACSAEVIISEDFIHYPYVRSADILVCMSQGGFDKFISRTNNDGVLLFDSDLVRVTGFSGKAYSIPCTRMAEELGRKMMANIIMIGFITSITSVVSSESARSTVAETVPKGTEEMNIKAFEKGYDYGVAILKGIQKKAAGKSGA
jgi:2-oxoglutarate ferredoxin oxidoreductase subunit gamma